MLCLALVLELHHPLAGPDEPVGRDWAVASIDSFWPLLRAVSSFAERPSGGSLTLAVSPSWTALASDPTGRARVMSELDRRPPSPAAGSEPLRAFVDRWQGDAMALVRHLGETAAVEVIPITSSHAWLPGVAQEPVVARAQVRLAASDHVLRLGRRGAGIWLPFLGYMPGLESIVGEAGIRYFGVPASTFLRGTVLPPDQLSAPMITPPGVAVFGVNPAPAEQVVDAHAGYGRDYRYHNPAEASRAVEDHADHFVKTWLSVARAGIPQADPAGEPSSVVALSAHDLGRGWPNGLGGHWLHQVLARLSRIEDAATLGLGRCLDRQPAGVVGRPGPSIGGILAARPGESDLYDRCRVAADLLAHAVEHRRELGPLERRSVAHMTRCLLRAQQVDWSLPPGFGVDVATGIRRSEAHLENFQTLAGLLMAGRPDRRLLDHLDRGPAFLPSLNLDLLAAGGPAC